MKITLLERRCVKIWQRYRFYSVDQAKINIQHTMQVPDIVKVIIPLNVGETGGGQLIISGATRYVVCSPAKYSMDLEGER